VLTETSLLMSIFWDLEVVALSLKSQPWNDISSCNCWPCKHPDVPITIILQMLSHKAYSAAACV